MIFPIDRQRYDLDTWTIKRERGSCVRQRNMFKSKEIVTYRTTKNSKSDSYVSACLDSRTSKKRLTASEAYDQMTHDDAVYVWHLDVGFVRDTLSGSFPSTRRKKKQLSLSDTSQDASFPVNDTLSCRRSSVSMEIPRPLADSRTKNNTPQSIRSDKEHESYEMSILVRLVQKRTKKILTSRRKKHSRSTQLWKKLFTLDRGLFQ